MSDNVKVAHFLHYIVIPRLMAYQMDRRIDPTTKAHIAQEIAEAKNFAKAMLGAEADQLEADRKEASA